MEVRNGSIHSLVIYSNEGREKHDEVTRLQLKSNFARLQRRHITRLHHTAVRSNSSRIAVYGVRDTPVRKQSLSGRNSHAFSDRPLPALFAVASAFPPNPVLNQT